MVLGTVMVQFQAVAVLFFIWFLSRAIRKRSNIHRLPLPPGPKGYPLIGSVLDFPTYKPWLVYAEWFKKYNSDIIYFEVLGQPFLVTNSLRRINDLLEKRSSNYSDRMRMPMVLELMDWGYNLAFLPYGDWWRRHRRVFHEHFRPNAVGKYQPVQLQAARALLRDLLDTPDNFIHHIRHMFGAMIMKTTYGLDVRGSNHQYIENAEEALKGVAQAGIPGRFLVDFIPVLKYVPDWFPGAKFKREARYWRELNHDVETLPFEHVIRDVNNGIAVPSVASRLIEKLTSDNDPRREEEEEIARHVAAVAYVGGVDTTQSVVQAFLLAMAMYPSVQKKAQDEIDTVVGLNRLPDYNDRSELPYINALVKEAMRWHVVAPLGVAHMATNEDVYDGYYIPKGTLILGSTWEILSDPEAFENPEEFMPERYLTPNGELNPNARDPDVAAFGFGRRICPGRYMSDNTLYIVVVSLLATYSIKPPLGDEGNEVRLTHDVSSALISYPLPFKCRITPRSKVAEMLIRESEGSI